MLKTINDLKFFFEDCYRRINVREYAKLAHISPPTASKLLDYYNLESILVKTAYKNYTLFYANKESKDFIDLSRIYWRQKLAELVSLIEKKLVSSTIVLFGSLSKGEAMQDSDIDLAVFAKREEFDFESFGKKLKRNAQVFWFDSLDDIKNKDLRNNIINGYVLKGKLAV